MVFCVCSRGAVKIFTDTGAACLVIAARFEIHTIAVCAAKIVVRSGTDVFAVTFDDAFAVNVFTFVPFFWIVSVALYTDGIAGKSLTWDFVMLILPNVADTFPSVCENAVSVLPLPALPVTVPSSVPRAEFTAFPLMPSDDVLEYVSVMVGIAVPLGSAPTSLAESVISLVSDLLFTFLDVGTAPTSAAVDGMDGKSVICDFVCV